MNFDNFVNEMQHRLERPGRGPTVRAIRAVLTALGERLHPDEARNLASNLPMEIDRFLLEADSGQRFDYQEFVKRISEIDQSDPPDAAYLAQLVMGVISEAVPEGELRDVRNSLPDDFEDLFEQTSLAPV